MSTVRMLRSGQLTLPAKIRQMLGLEEGAFLEAGVKDNRIVLIPKKMVEKDEAKERIFNMVETVWKKNKNVSAEEVGKEVIEAMKTVRSHKGK